MQISKITRTNLMQIKGWCFALSGSLAVWIPLYVENTAPMIRSLSLESVRYSGISRIWSFSLFARQRERSSTRNNITDFVQWVCWICSQQIYSSYIYRHALYILGMTIQSGQIRVVTSFVMSLRDKLLFKWYTTTVVL